MSPKVTFWYLATPYTLYPDGMDAAYEMACAQASRFVRAGIPVFCPIAHSHGIVQAGKIDGGAHDIWLPADQPFVDAASGLVIVTAVGWQRSKGIKWEFDQFYKAGKPILHTAPGKIPPECFPSA